MNVSVVVPARDAASTLATTLESLGRADAVSEVVVVDDGSTDATATVARRAAAGLEAEVRVLVRTEPGGVSVARNAGAAVARGDVLAFFDADDLWWAGTPDPRLPLLDGGADVALGRLQCLRPGTDGLEPYAEPFRAFTTGVALIRRRAFEAVGGFEPGLAQGEELDWLLRARQAGLALEWVDEVVLGYRLHVGTASARRGDRHHGLLAALHRSTHRSPAPVRRAGPEVAAAALTVSAILPTLNAAAFVDRALAGLAAQSHQPLEVLVVDGGSTDDTPAIARRWPGVRVLERPAAGVPAAYNEGLEEAQGDVIVFLAADDQLEPGALAAHVAALGAVPEADMSVGLVELVGDPGGVSLRTPEGLVGTIRRSRVLEALAVRRRTVERHGSFLEDLGASADVEWVQRLGAAQVEVVEVDTVVVRKYLHRANTSYERGDGGAELLAALRKGIERRRDGR